VRLGRAAGLSRAAERRPGSMSGDAAAASGCTGTVTMGSPMTRSPGVPGMMTSGQVRRGRVHQGPRPRAMPFLVLGLHSEEARPAAPLTLFTRREPPQCPIDIEALRGAPGRSRRPSSLTGWISRPAGAPIRQAAVLTAVASDLLRPATDQTSGTSSDVLVASRAPTPRPRTLGKLVRGAPGCVTLPAIRLFWTRGGAGQWGMRYFPRSVRTWREPSALMIPVCEGSLVLGSLALDNPDTSGRSSANDSRRDAPTSRRPLIPQKHRRPRAQLHDLLLPRLAVCRRRGRDG
jgi:hypothetical protein